MFPDPEWWITMVELPVLGGLFWLIWRSRGETAAANEDTRRASDLGDIALREALAAFKLEVAKSYASLANLQDVERRLVAHLLRIEGKLDGHLTDPDSGD